MTRTAPLPKSDTAGAAPREITAWLEVLPDATALVDAAGVIIAVNALAEELFGYERAELIGEPIERLVPERLRESHVAHRRTFEAAPRKRSMGSGVLIRGRRKDGSEFPCEISLGPLEGPGGRQVLAAVRDVTERIEQQQELEEQSRELARSNQELEQFAYVASHDLQQPLRMITSYTQLLARRYRDELDADAEQFIGFVVDGAARMKALINDLLALSRVGAKGEAFEPFRLQDVLAKTRRDLGPLLEETGAVLEVSELPEISGSEEQLVQLFNNLVGNAIKFQNRDEPPRIVVGAYERDHELEVFVQDNGIGIAPEHRERVFSIFQRLHTQDEYSGTGIGLALCRKVVERHGGRIWVESEPGQGSTFHLTFPKPQNGASPPATP